MPEQISPTTRTIVWFAVLMVPVIVLLFSGLRRRRTIAYPHDLVTAGTSRVSMMFLFRTIRVYRDLVMDSLLALACATIIAGAWSGTDVLRLVSPGQEDVIVMDASLSMLSGMYGDRPLDRAARMAVRLADDTADRRRQLYALVWDTATMRSTIRNLGTIKATDSALTIASMVERATPGMSADPRQALAGLASPGRAVTFLTDDTSTASAAEHVPAIQVLTVPDNPGGYLYPVSAFRNEATGKPTVRFVSGGGAEPETVFEVSVDGSYRRAKPEDWTIRPLAGSADMEEGFELEFASPGIYAIGWKGHVLPFAAPGPLRRDNAADGSGGRDGAADSTPDTGAAAPNRRLSGRRQVMQWLAARGWTVHEAEDPALIDGTGSHPDTGNASVTGGDTPGTEVRWTLLALRYGATRSTKVPGAITVADLPSHVSGRNARPLLTENLVETPLLTTGSPVAVGHVPGIDFVAVTATAASSEAARPFWLMERATHWPLTFDCVSLETWSSGHSPTPASGTSWPVPPADYRVVAGWTWNAIGDGYLVRPVRRSDDVDAAFVVIPPAYEYSGTGAPADVSSARLSDTGTAPSRTDDRIIPAILLGLLLAVKAFVSAPSRQGNARRSRASWRAARR